MTRDPLSRRQLEIADGIRRGLSYAEIAGELRISRLTVRAHVIAMAARLRPLADDPKRPFSPREIVERWLRLVA